MMQSDLLQYSGPVYTIPACSILDDMGLYDFSRDQCDFSSSLPSGGSTEISIESYFAITTPDDNVVEFPTFSDSEENLSSEHASEAAIWSLSPPIKQSSPPSRIESLKLVENYHMDSDSPLVLHHLLSAYAEAMENGQQELKQVIIKRINEKIDPLGKPMERVAFHLFQSNENEGEYLRHQSSKNFEAAFRAFYQWYPYARFAHFAANSAIFEAIPEDAETVHIVDFDMGDGIQWPPLIEAVLQKGKDLRLTSVRSEENCSPVVWNFDETRRRLLDHARSVGLNLRVEQMTAEDFTAEVRRIKKRSGGKEWLAFNCMVGLPHMGRRQDRAQAIEFVRWAEDLLAIAAISTLNNAGIVTLGDGKTGNNLETDAAYSSFFNDQLMHYHALLDSMECSNFPVCITEARIAMESLFAAPDICPISWFKQWKESPQAPAVIGLDGRRISKESLIEAKEIVKEKESPYKLKIQGKSENQLVLEWKGIPLVTVSSWM